MHQNFSHLHSVAVIQQGPCWKPDVGQQSDYLDYHLVQYVYDVSAVARVCLSPPRVVNGADSAARLPWPAPTRHLDGGEPGPSSPLQVLEMCCFFPPSMTNHHRADGVVPAGAALPVKLIAGCVQTMKLICSPFGILFGLGECQH